MQRLRSRIQNLSKTVKCVRRRLPAAALWLMLPVAALSGGAFDLRVNDLSGLDAPWPLLGGLPFPEGDLYAHKLDPEVDGMRQTSERVFQTRYRGRLNPHRWHVRLEIPASAGSGIYQLDFPGAERVDVINSEAVETSAFAPEGFLTRGDGVAGGGGARASNVGQTYRRKQNAFDVCGK